MTYLYSYFAVAQRPRMKKRYQRRVEKVKEYLEFVKDFDELVSPQSLFLHFLGPNRLPRFGRIWKLGKRVCIYAFFILFFFSPFSFFLSFFLSFSLFFFIFLFFYFCLILSGMVTRFSKQKLTKAQEKKAKGGTISGLLSKKKIGDVSKKDPVTTIPPAHPPVSALPLLLHHWR